MVDLRSSLPPLEKFLPNVVGVAIAPKCLGGLPVDRDLRTAYTGSMLAKNLKKYFLDEDNLVASYEWIKDLFQDTPEGLSPSEEILIHFTSNEN
ncbi:hypothetical protein TNCV_3734951 [Trichonephila clavipes]|nr:hypothetical protein TNCV_3734951 [Trichonephila clavipes]